MADVCWGQDLTVWPRGPCPRLAPRLSRVRSSRVKQMPGQLSHVDKRVTGSWFSWLFRSLERSAEKERRSSLQEAGALARAVQRYLPYLEALSQAAAPNAHPVTRLDRPAAQVTAITRPVAGHVSYLPRAVFSVCTPGPTSSPGCSLVSLLYRAGRGTCRKWPWTLLQSHTRAHESSSGGPPTVCAEPLSGRGRLGVRVFGASSLDGSPRKLSIKHRCDIWRQQRACGRAHPHPRDPGQQWAHAGKEHEGTPNLAGIWWTQGGRQSRWAGTCWGPVASPASQEACLCRVHLPGQASHMRRVWGGGHLHQRRQGRAAITGCSRERCRETTTNLR